MSKVESGVLGQGSHWEPRPQKASVDLNKMPHFILNLSLYLVITASIAGYIVYLLLSVARREMQDNRKVKGTHSGLSRKL